MGLVSFSPLLAAWIRARGWPARREKLGVVAAVILGLAIGHAAQWVANEWTARVLVPRAIEKGLAPKDYAVRYRAERTSAPVMLADSVLFFFLSGGLGLGTYFLEQRRALEQAREREVGELQLQKRQADLQLLVLQAQIEPHFLFNTLASLRSLLRQDIGRAEAMLDALVAHLRSALPLMRASRETSTLAEQLAVCGSYLELMQIRLPDRLSYAIRVPQDLHGAPFPPLVLLTLVENAVKHGIEPKPGAGHIRIEARREHRPDGTHLLVSVTDDGVGLSSAHGHGVGLSNIRSQLGLKYGGRAALSLSGSTHGGAVASIDIPEERDGTS
jgi:sensor histidine kinase YesM